MPLIDADLAGLIGEIYDAVIEKAIWPDVLQRVSQRFDFRMAALSVHDMSSGRAIVQATANMSQQDVALMQSYSDEVTQIWGGQERMARMPVEEPLVNSRVTTPGNWSKNRFYLEWAVPRGIVDQVGILLARDRNLFGALGLSVHVTRRPVSDEDLDDLRVLTPHFRRAVVISRMIDVAADNALTFQATVDAASTAIIIVDASMRVLHANGAASSLLQAGDPVRTRNGLLMLREEIVHGQLRQAIEAAAEDESRLGRRGMAILGRLLDGTASTLTVLPLENRIRRGNLGVGAVAAIFIAGTAEPPPPRDAMRVLYDLTPAEQRIFEMIIGGRTTTEIAADLGIGIGTVRTHVLRIFEKTGRRNRADLVRLARRLTPAA